MVNLAGMRDRKAYFAALYLARRSKGLCRCGRKAVKDHTKCRKHLKLQNAWNNNR